MNCFFQLFFLLIVSLTVVESVLSAADPDKAPPLEFISVPEGCFQMGDNIGDGYYNEYPLHEVCLSSFHIARTPVTRLSFREFVEETGYRTEAEKGGGCYIFDGKSWRKSPTANWRSPGFTQEDDHPVVCVSWNDAVAYNAWFSGQRKQSCRLPTEAEWEYAARSGGKIEKYAGGNVIDDVAWYSANSGNRTHGVAQKQANGLGLYDMSGNVWQWTADWYGESYYRASPRSNPTGPLEGTNRVFRGGSWFYDQKGIRVSYRDFFLPGYRSSHLGFRPVCAEK